MSVYKRNTNESRPNAELAAAMVGRRYTIGWAAEYADAVARRTDPTSLLSLVTPAPHDAAPTPKILVPSEIASNVISLAARREDQAVAQALDEQTDVLSEQDQRAADAREIIKDVA